MGKQAFKQIKNQGIELFKTNRDMVTNVFDNYLLNRLQGDGIHNDLGASFTHLVRYKDRIRKTAAPRGEEKLIQEMDWYLRFHDSKFAKYIPKVLDYSREPGNVFYEMKYYNFPNLRKIIIDDMNAIFFLRRRWRHLFDLLQEYLYTSAQSAAVPASFLDDCHFRKYEKRMRETRENAPFLTSLLDQDAVSINRLWYLGPDVILGEVKNNTAVRSALTPQRLYISHGDIHTNNILCGMKAKNMILLDCRGQSPHGGDYFDTAYDVAKLYHDLRSQYSLIEKHLFSVFLHDTEETSRIEFEFTRPDLVTKFYRNYEYVRTLVAERLAPFGNVDYRANFTEAMLWLTMVPLHLKSHAEGLMCLTVGMVRLNEWLRNYHDDLYQRLAQRYIPTTDR